MDRIATSVERDPSYQARVHFTQTRLEPTTADALAGSARQIASTVSATAMVCYTSSGSTARRIARERPPVPLLAMSASLHTSRRLGLLWGVHAVHTRDVVELRGDGRKGQAHGASPPASRKGGDRVDRDGRNSVRDRGIHQRAPRRPARSATSSTATIRAGNRRGDRPTRLISGAAAPELRRRSLAARKPIGPTFFASAAPASP